MKMNYHLKSSNFEDRRKNGRQKILLIVVVIIVSVLVLITTPFRNMLFSVAEPIWKMEDRLLNSNFFDYFKSKQTLINERDEALANLYRAGSLMAINSTLQNENDNLKDLLGRKDIKQKTVLASVLVKPPQISYDSIIIDIGEDNNVKIGDKVTANSNIYIGEVSEVNPHSSKVVLYSTPGKKLSVILGTNQVSMEAVGIGGGNFNIFLPKEIEVKENDVIIIPSINPNVFGIVEKINYTDKDSFQTVLFKSPINISELRYVEVVLSK